MKLQQFKHQNQFIIRGEGKTVFQSYDSTIAIIENRALTLGRDWDYSHTTLKHLYLFLDEEARYSCNYETREAINNVLSSSNKKAKMQKMIDSGVINYNEEL